MWELIGSLSQLSTPWHTLEPPGTPWNPLYPLAHPGTPVPPGSQRGYLIAILDELLPADVGHDASSQRVPQDIDHCSKPVSAK